MSEVRSRVGTKVGLASRGHGRPKQIGRIVKDGATLGRSASPERLSLDPATNRTFIPSRPGNCTLITANHHDSLFCSDKTIAASNCTMRSLKSAQPHTSGRPWGGLTAPGTPHHPRPTLSTFRPDLLYLRTSCSLILLNVSSFYLHPLLSPSASLGTNVRTVA
jgi:hypothetical protein